MAVAFGLYAIWTAEKIKHCPINIRIPFTLFWGIMLTVGLCVIRSYAPVADKPLTLTDLESWWKNSSRGMARSGISHPKTSGPKRGLTNEVKLRFKDSPLLTTTRKKLITGDLTRLKFYLSDLGIKTPEETPPIGVNTVGVSGGSRQGNAPDYMNALLIPKSELDHRYVITASYCWYALSKILSPVYANTDAENFQRMVAEGYFTEYFNWSFWDSPQPGFRFAVTQALWEVRRRYGAPFTDRLVAIAVRTYNDAPNRDFNQNRELFFYLRIKDADSVIDNEVSKLQTIRDIWVKHGLPAE